MLNSTLLVLNSVNPKKDLHQAIAHQPYQSPRLTVHGGFSSNHVMLVSSNLACMERFPQFGPVRDYQIPRWKALEGRMSI